VIWPGRALPAPPGAITPNPARSVRQISNPGATGLLLFKPPELSGKTSDLVKVTATVKGDRGIRIADEKVGGIAVLLPVSISGIVVKSHSEVNYDRELLVLDGVDFKAVLGNLHNIRFRFLTREYQRNFYASFTGRREIELRLTSILDFLHRADNVNTQHWRLPETFYSQFLLTVIGRIFVIPFNFHPWTPIGIKQILRNVSLISHEMTLPEGYRGIRYDETERKALDNKALGVAGGSLCLVGFFLLYKIWWKMSFNLSANSNVAVYMALVFVSAAVVWIGQWCLFSALELVP
jgi:hypothetical protein